MARLKVAILISGRGSNMEALLAACRDGRVAADPVLVLANRADAAGLAIAQAAGVPTRVVPHRSFGERAAFEAALDAALKEVGTELVCLAGFMRLLTKSFVEAWRDRMINIHPSLLPAFPGLDTHRRALAAGVKFAGCTVHYVRFETDTGPIVAQAAVPVLGSDDEARLAARVLEAEHRLYPLALGLIAAGKVKIEGERAIVDAPGPKGESRFNPAEGPGKPD
jgi:phosphoribosylglycinamide formyltransferase-1